MAQALCRTLYHAYSVSVWPTYRAPTRLSGKLNLPSGGWINRYPIQQMCLNETFPLTKNCKFFEHCPMSQFQGALIQYERIDNSNIDYLVSFIPWNVEWQFHCSLFCLGLVMNTHFQL